MNLFLRFLWTVLKALRAPAIQVLDTTSMLFRVAPNDLDLNGHMHHGRFFSIMDLGRAELALRTGVQQAAFRNGWTALIGAAVIRYRSSLEPFRRYQLVTRLACWDDKWLYFEQRFVMENDPSRVVAIGWVKAMFRDRKRNVAPSEVLSLARMGAPESPPVPVAVRFWNEAEAQMFEPSMTERTAPATQYGVPLERPTARA
jgi:acyl-CoA thioesterase FadM